MAGLGPILTAIVTPFDDDLAVDEDAFVELMHHLCAHGSDGVVVAATTGEAPTLTYEEHVRLVELAVQRAPRGRDDRRQHRLQRHAPRVRDDRGRDGARRRRRALGDAVLQPAHRAAGSCATTPRSRARPTSPSSSTTSRRARRSTSPTTCSPSSRRSSASTTSSRPTTTTSRRSTACGSLRGQRRHARRTCSTSARPAASSWRATSSAPRCAGWSTSPSTGARSTTVCSDLFGALAVTTNPIPVKAALNLLGHRVGGLRLPLVEADEDERDVVRAVLERHGLLAGAGA